MKRLSIHHCLACFIYWIVLSSIQTLSAELKLECLNTKASQYSKVEFRMQPDHECSNPFDPDIVSAHLEITSPDGSKLQIPAFYSQNYEWKKIRQGNRTKDWFYPSDAGWKAFYTPKVEGVYQAQAFFKEGLQIYSSRKMEWICQGTSKGGFLKVSSRDSRFLEFSDGKPFFPIGQNLAFIGDEQYVSLSKAEEIMEKMGANGANYLRIWTCCEDWAMAIEARKSVWGRSWSGSRNLMPIEVGSTQRCAVLKGEKARLEVSPSHAVALKPGVRYKISGSYQLTSNSKGYLDVQGHSYGPWESKTNSWQDFACEFTTGDNDLWLSRMMFRMTGDGEFRINKLSLKEAIGGPELLWEAEINRSIRGYYNPLDCYMLDQIVEMAERHGIYLQLCVLTRDLYMDSLKDPQSSAYQKAIDDAKKFMRYAAARWGYSTHLAAWEYFNEMNPGLPTERFYREVGEYLEQIDCNRHLRMTSAWGPAPNDYRHPKLDFADLHFYLRPSDHPRLKNEVEAVFERTEYLRKIAPNKPAHLGEFGVADEKWMLREEMKRSPEIVDVHNALWASILSGASGSAQQWWWERLDQRDAYKLYRPVSKFVADLPWTDGVTSAKIFPPENILSAGLQVKDQVWFWLFDPRASWRESVIEKRTPPLIENISIAVKGLATPKARIEWYDTRTGLVIRKDETPVLNHEIQTSPPSFIGDIAGKVIGFGQ